jgi:hypothetical protein
MRHHLIGAGERDIVQTILTKENASPELLRGVERYAISVDDQALIDRVRLALRNDSSGTES